MKCPKCHYLGFETGDRCKNCGYDFSLLTLADAPASAAPHPETDLMLRPDTHLEAMSGKGEKGSTGSETSPTHVAPSTVPDTQASGFKSVGGGHQSDEKKKVALPGSAPVGTGRSGR